MTIIKIIVIVLIILYITGFINSFLYTQYKYKEDKKKLENKRREKVAGIKTQNVRNGTDRYARDISDSIVKGVEDEFDQKIKNLKRKLIHDQIENITKVIKNILFIK